MGTKPTPGKPAIVKMIRPEDRQPKPCVAEVAEDKVDEWKAAGWVVKTTPDEPEEMRAESATTPQTSAQA
jgi:hypothetical protein